MTISPFVHKGKNSRQNRKRDNYSPYSWEHRTIRTIQKRSNKESMGNTEIIKISDKSKTVLQYFTPSNYLIINHEFDKFLKILDPLDRKSIESAVKEIKSYPFVERIDFEMNETPTIIIKLSEVNRENKSKIYGIEYNLLRETDADIDFYIRPF